MVTKSISDGLTPSEEHALKIISEKSGLPVNKGINWLTTRLDNKCQRKSLGDTLNRWIDYEDKEGNKTSKAPHLEYITRTRQVYSIFTLNQLQQSSGAITFRDELPKDTLHWITRAEYSVQEVIEKGMALKKLRRDIKMKISTILKQIKSQYLMSQKEIW
jgi:hypothetical protein